MPYFIPGWDFDECFRVQPGPNEPIKWWFKLFAISQVTVIFFVLAFSIVFTLQSRVGEQLVAYLKSLPSQLQKCLGPGKGKD